MVPVNVGSILRKLHRPHYRLRVLTIALVGKAGLGRDIWTLKFSSINHILYVRLLDPS